VQGFRQVRYQTTSCSTCGRKVFVLPLSPLPPVAPPGAPTPPSVRLSGPPRRFNRTLILQVVFGILLLVLLGVVVGYIFRPTAKHTSARDTLLKEIQKHREEGELALREGSFQVAARELEAAWQDSLRSPHLVTQADKAQLRQLHSQAKLLADLLEEPLEVILHNLNVPVEQRQADFASRYQDKAIVFLDTVRRDGSGPAGDRRSGVVP
jgi:hypothetical protein